MKLLDFLDMRGIVYSSVVSAFLKDEDVTDLCNPEIDMIILDDDCVVKVGEDDV